MVKKILLWGAFAALAGACTALQVRREAQLAPKIERRPVPTASLDVLREVTGLRLDRDANRQAFGRNALPIWSPLSPFEREALRALDAARSGQPDALLKLAIAAHHGSKAAFENAQQQVHEFVAGIFPQLEEIADPQVRGKRLMIAMHRTFLTGRFDSQAHSLPLLFATGDFSRESSTLLYAILARALGFSTQVILLPSAAWAELRLEDGRIVTVDAASRNGYNIDSGRGVGHVINLPSLVAVTLLSQSGFDCRPDRTTSCTATGNTLPSYRDREFAGYLSNGLPHLEIGRLEVYQQEHRALTEHGNFKALGRMFNLIAPEVTALHLQSFENPAIRTALASHDLARIETWVQLERLGKAKNELARLLLTRGAFKKNPRKAEQTQRALHLSEVLARAYLDSAQEHRVSEVFRPLTRRCRWTAWCRRDPAPVYLAWARVYREDDKPEASATVLKACLQANKKSAPCRDALHASQSSIR